VLTFVKEARKAHYATGTASAAHATDPVQPLPEKVDLPAEKVAMGERMFHDKRLSADETLSCASCHDLGKGGCDQARTSKGIGGQFGGINSPTVFNSGANVRQFWDGRAADLVEQAAGPVENPIEMGAKWDDVVAKLNKDAALVAEFGKLYPDGLTKGAVLDCVATFEKSLVTPNSPFDRWLSGDENALDADAKKGYELFVARGCATCHVGESLGGQSFEKMGRAEDYFEARGNPTDADKGLEGFTKKEGDRHKFKVPTLRNVALTFPWFHDGSQTDLAGAVKVMAKCELGTTLSDAEVAQVVKFLESLTGEFRGVPLK
jgi:cytochrome c peroxidase